MDRNMGLSDDSSDPEWKNTNIKTEKGYKQELNSSLNKPKYSQKFCEKWLSIFHPWLTRCDDEPNKPFCRACQCRLDCNRCHLQRHERTTKHARNLEILINKGEGAARQNLSIRQERSKYYQQRKKLNASTTSSQDASDMGVDTTEDYIEEFERERKSSTKLDSSNESGFQFVESAPGDHFAEETALKQENISTDGNGDPLPANGSPKNLAHLRAQNAKKGGAKKERMKLLMQIQKDKNELMDSFKELISSGGVAANFHQSPPKEKNHVDLFFESVSSSVKALSPKLIAETKMRVSQLICELELRALTENDANNANSAAAGATAAVVVSSDASTGNAFIINQPVVHSTEVTQTGEHNSNAVESGTHAYHTISVSAAQV